MTILFEDDKMADTTQFHGEIQYVILYSLSPHLNWLAVILELILKTEHRSTFMGNSQVFFRSKSCFVEIAQYTDIRVVARVRKV